MIQYIQTDKGNYGTLRDIYLDMKHEKYSKINITEFRIWSGDLKILHGVYSFDEIKNIVMG